MMDAEALMTATTFCKLVAFFMIKGHSSRQVNGNDDRLVSEYICRLEFGLF